MIKMNLSLLITMILASLASIGRVWITILFAIVTGWFLAYASVKIEYLKIFT